MDKTESMEGKTIADEVHGRGVIIHELSTEVSVRFEGIERLIMIPKTAIVENGVFEDFHTEP